jgi:hypothetical protein
MVDIDIYIAPTYIVYFVIDSFCPFCEPEGELAAERGVEHRGAPGVRATAVFPTVNRFY